MPPADDEPRARDCLDQLPVRRAAGEDLLDRVRSRVRNGPRWARVFERLGVPDPYDDEADDQPLGLGPVGVKLADRRRPAPHARPPKGKENPLSTAPRQPEGRPSALRLAEAPKPAAAEPVSTASPPPASAAASPAVKAPPARSPADPALEPSSPIEEPPEVPSLPLPPGAKSRSRSGRVRLAPRAVSTGPRVKEIPRPSEVLGEDSVEKVEPETPPIERAPPGPDMGLDDLFGFSGGGGRMKTPKSDKKKE